MEDIMKYSVYARADENSKVTKIFSTCFEQQQDTDILIKSGIGDEYVHVQEQYQLFDENGCHNYKLVDGSVTECTEEEKAEELAGFPQPEPTTEERVNAVEEAIDFLLTEMLV